MAEANELLSPIEVPWKLASTTQPLSANEPAETALSLFFFEPDDETLTSKFADERIVFVKYTASISPAKFPAALSKVAATFDAPLVIPKRELAHCFSGTPALVHTSFSVTDKLNTGLSRA